MSGRHRKRSGSAAVAVLHLGNGIGKHTSAGPLTSRQDVTVRSPQSGSHPNQSPHINLTVPGRHVPTFARTAAHAAKTWARVPSPRRFTSDIRISQSESIVIRPRQYPRRCTLQEGAALARRHLGRGRSDEPPKPWAGHGWPLTGDGVEILHNCAARALPVSPPTGSTMIHWQYSGGSGRRALSPSAGPDRTAMKCRAGSVVGSSAR